MTSPTEDLMKIGVGARPMGMGKAFVAVADDGNAVFLNPAGLSELKTWQVTSMYVNLLEGEAPYTVLSGSYPFKFGNMGVGVISTGTSNIISPSSQSISYFDYYDRLYFLSFGGDAGRVRLGGNLKLFSKGFTGSQTNTGTGLNCDLGLKYYPNSWSALGVNIQNLLPTKVRWDTNSTDDIPMLVKVGGAARTLNQKLLLAMDVDFSLGRDIPTPIHLGAEWPVSQNLSLRAGLDQILSASSNLSNNPTMGVGLNFSGISFNYAYHPYIDSPTSVSHFMSLSYAPEIKPPKAVQPALKPEAAPAVVPQAPATPETMTLYKVMTDPFKNRKSALALVKKLQDKGFETYMYIKERLYYIQLGAFSEKELADALVQMLGAEGQKVTIFTEEMPTPVVY